MDDIDRFLEEDIGSGDITTETFVPDVPGRAVITCEDETVVAGLEEAAEVFKRLGVTASPEIEDGTRVPGGTAVMRLEGPERGITTAERTALNILHLQQIAVFLILFGQLQLTVNQIFRQPDLDAHIADGGGDAAFIVPVINAELN